MEITFLRRTLLAVVAAILVFNAVGLVISVAAELPTEFDTKGDPDNVLEDSLTKGTLIAAPVIFLVVLAVCALLASMRQRLVATLGLMALVVLGSVAAIGILGEPLHPEASDPPVAFLVAWKIVGTALACSLVAIALANLYRVWRPTPASVPG